MIKTVPPGRLVLITGAARGIGRAIAQAFLANGDRVAMTDAVEDVLAASARALGCDHFVLDVRDAQRTLTVVSQIEAQLGSIDVVINNAGVMSRSSVAETDADEWRRVIETNLNGVFNVSHAAITGMITRRRGWIINIGSIWASHAWPNRAAYAASKAAVEHFTRCFAIEVAPFGIRVNAISPGIMATDMTSAVLDNPEFRAKFMSRVALGMIGEPGRHIAGIALVLTAPSADYLCGEIINAHGGYY